MLSINDLPENRELDSKAMTAVSGGYALADLGPLANINISIDQDITQFQNVQVSALNNIGVLGADLGPLNFAVSPTQWAANYASLGQTGNPYSYR